jgi:SNF2 family DNA or RNA helicase
MQLVVETEEMNESYERHDQPANINITLWPHQLTMLARCIQYETQPVSLTDYGKLVRHRHICPGDYFKTHIGIIGDKVGSGKSYTVLALISSSSGTLSSNTVKSYGDNKLVLSFTEKCNVISTNMLVIPHNLVSQWRGYIARFSDTLMRDTIFVYKSSHVDDLVGNVNQIAEARLVVVSAPYYNKLVHIVSSVNFKLSRVIFDEVDNINLPNCMCIDSNFYWFVTASYINLLYPKGYYRYDTNINKTVWYAHGLRNSGFVRNIFLDLYSTLSVDFVQVLVLKNNEAYIETSITLPPVQQHIVACTSPIEISILDGYTDIEVIRSLNARDIASAMRHLKPSHLTTEENIISLQIAKYTQEIFNYGIRIQAMFQMTYDTEEQREADIQKVTKKKDDVESKVDGIQNRIRSSNTCCICYEPMVSKTVTPCCSHAFCFACLNIWLSNNRSCPMCKAALTSGDLLVVDDRGSSLEDDDPEASIAAAGREAARFDVDPAYDKVRNLEMLLRSKMTSSSKVLIFSSYDMSFQCISNVLKKVDMEFRCLKGNEQHIRATVKRYREQDLNVLFINARNFGSGMNLENTTDIILFHKMDTEIEKQVIGRAQRFGRTTPLRLWYLLHENEMLVRQEA